MAATLAHALEMAVRTDVGLIRSHNEDAVFCDPVLGLAILADGMGGYNAGEVASGMATALLAAMLTESLRDRDPSRVSASTGVDHAHEALVDSIAQANAAIHGAAAREPQYAGMGTTLVVALFHDDRATVAHIGDSRLYRLRDGELLALTRDHSLLQEQIDAGMISAEAARFSVNRNLVTRALGVDPEVDPEIHAHAVLPGDLYLLCSDGLHDMVEEGEIELTLSALGADLDLAAMQLVQMANDNGGRDNVSVILVRILGRFPAAPGWRAALRNWFK